MGSDGIFEYLSNKDIIDISGDSLIKNNIDKSCLDLIEKSAELFKEKEKRIDDITINIIILWLKVIIKNKLYYFCNIDVI